MRRASWLLPNPFTSRRFGVPIMPLVTLRTVLDHAAENNYGVAAFNVNNMMAASWLG